MPWLLIECALPISNGSCLSLTNKDHMFALVMVSLIIIGSFTHKHMVRDVFVSEMPSPTAHTLNLECITS